MQLPLPVSWALKCNSPACRSREGKKERRKEGKKKRRLYIWYSTWYFTWHMVYQHQNESLFSLFVLYFRTMACPLLLADVLPLGTTFLFPFVSELLLLDEVPCLHRDSRSDVLPVRAEDFYAW